MVYMCTTSLHSYFIGILCLVFSQDPSPSFRVSSCTESLKSLVLLVTPTSCYRFFLSPYPIEVSPSVSVTYPSEGKIEIMVPLVSLSKFVLRYTRLNRKKGSY